jgi:localization factor PodJL
VALPPTGAAAPFGHHAAADPPAGEDPFFTPDSASGEDDAERPLTTRELIAQARNAARAAGGGAGAADPAPERGLFKGKSDKSKGFKAKADPAAAGDPAAKPARGPFGLALPRRKRKDDGVSTVTLLLATAVSLTVTATVLGFMIVNDGTKDEGHGAALIAKAGDAPTAAPPLTGDATAGAPSTQANELAVATAPNPAGALAPSGPVDEGKALYTTAVSQLQANDAKALPTLIRAAAAGYPAAQFHLSKIYERGGAGQTADLVKARMWAERAAKAGVAEAMFNLGLFMYEGQGGPPDLPGAADWFTRAAKLGLKDAQYNLARLYENGYGVTQNFSLAYQWYLVAADVSGDKEAHADADRLRPTLTAEGRKTAERFAQTFRPEPAAAYASAPTTGKLAQSR